MPKVFKILLIIFFSIIILLTIPLIIYFLWLNRFEKDINNRLCLSNMQTETESFDERIKDFVFSTDRSAYIQFTDKELLPLVTNTFQNNNTLNVKNICLDSEDGIWKVYLNMNIGSKNILWFIFDIVKDDRETAELYVNNLYIGNIKIPSFISSSLKNSINKGISDAVLLVNENSFSGREITNIELLNDKVVIKGIK